MVSLGMAEYRSLKFPPESFFFFELLNYLFTLFVLGLRWVFVAAWAFPSCGEQGLLFIAVASLVAEHRL